VKNWRTDAIAELEVLDDGCKLRIVLPLCTPSLNELMRRTGRFLSRDIRKWVRERAFALLIQTSPLNRATARRKIKFTSYRVKKLDDDNLRGGIKPVVDGLVDLGLLHDDSPAWATFEYEQVLVPQSERRTVIEVETVEALT